MSNISNLSISSAIEIIRQINNYQNNYDFCPNVKRLNPSKVFDDNNRIIATKSSSFWHNGGTLWVICIFLTGQITLTGVFLLIVNIINMIAPNILSESFRSTISIVGDPVMTAFGIIAFLYMLFLICWLKRILNKSKRIKNAQHECIEYDEEYKLIEQDYQQRFELERKRIMGELNTYISQNSVPKWMLEYHRGFNRQFTSNIYQRNYELTENKIISIYKNNYSNSPLAMKLDPLWLISPAYVTKTLIDISEKFPELTSFKQLETLYAQILKIKKDYLLMLTKELNKMRTWIKNDEREESIEASSRERINAQHNEIMKRINKQDELLKEHLKKANDYYDRKEVEDFYQYQKNRW